MPGAKAATFAGKGLSRNIPPSLQRLLLESLEDRIQPAYGQVATVDGRRRPQVRTVHLRFLPERGTLGFCAHIESPKWSHIRRDALLSGCHHDGKRLVQLRWAGSAHLIDAKTAGPEEARLLDRMWLLLRPEVRAAYWKDYGAKTFEVARRCPNLGLVVCRPSLWDVFRMHPTDYTKGTRMIYELKGKGWRARRVSPLHGRPL